MHWDHITDEFYNDGLGKKFIINYDVLANVKLFSTEGDVYNIRGGYTYLSPPLPLFKTVWGWKLLYRAKYCRGCPLNIPVLLTDFLNSCTELLPKILARILEILTLRKQKEGPGPCAIKLAPNVLFWYWMKCFLSNNWLLDHLRRTSHNTRKFVNHTEEGINFLTKCSDAVLCAERARAKWFW